MHDQRMLAKEPTIPKPQKKKPSTQKVSKLQNQESNVKRIQELTRSQPTQMEKKKSSKRGLTNQVPQVFQQQEKSTSDSLLDSSTSGDEYRALRRKYLLLEDESFELGKELREVEDKVNALEEEKLTILDELVVLESLVNPSEFKPHGQTLP